jgi:hypothetical protein
MRSQVLRGRDGGPRAKSREILEISVNEVPERLEAAAKSFDELEVGDPNQRRKIVADSTTEPAG